MHFRVGKVTTETSDSEMEYLFDQAWYDKEEGSSGDDAMPFFVLGDEAFDHKREITLTQSKEFAKLSADRAKWEGIQFTRALRRTSVPTDFDSENEKYVKLLVHYGFDLPFLDGRTELAKQAGPVILKDPKEDTEIPALKESVCQRDNSPINVVRGEIMKMIRDFQVVVLADEDGCGKATHLTQYLLEEGYGTNGIIGCTMPRRLAAMSAAKQVSEDIYTELGDRVGYAVRFEQKTGPNTVLKFMTDEVLLLEVLNDEELDNYRVIVVDVTHERGSCTDVLLAIMRSIVAGRRDIRLVVTSGARHAGVISSYFKGAPIFKIPSKTFDVNISYRVASCMNYIDEAAKLAMEIHKSDRLGDIVIFMTDRRDIKATCDTLLSLSQTQPRTSTMNLSILPVFSQLPADHIIARAGQGARKCVVSSDSVLHSIRLDGVSNAIDTGLVKVGEYNEITEMHAHRVCLVSRAVADQRAEFAGRVVSGRCHRLYTEYDYNMEMPPDPVPPSHRSNLEAVIFWMKALGIKDVFEFEFMDPPPRDNIGNTMRRLWIMGVINSVGRLTVLGKRMAKFPLTPSLGRLLLMGEDHSCGCEILTIVAMLSVPPVFVQPNNRELESHTARMKLMVPESDLLTLLNVYQQWESTDYSVRWCKENYLTFKGLSKARDVRSQLLHVLTESKIPVQSHTGDRSIIRKAICQAFFYNSAQLNTRGSVGEYVSQRTGTRCSLHPSYCALHHLSHVPEYVVYTGLCMQKGTSYAQFATSVDPRWLAELAPKFFSLSASDRTRELKEEKHAMDAEVESMRKEEAQGANETVKKGKQAVCMVGTGRTHSRPKKLLGL